MSEDMKTSIAAYIRAWGTMSRVYAGISIVLRGTLIIASALVAAKLGRGKLLSDCIAATLNVLRRSWYRLGSMVEAPREVLRFHDLLQERRRPLYATR